MNGLWGLFCLVMVSCFTQAWAGSGQERTLLPFHWQVDQVESSEIQGGKPAVTDTGSVSPSSPQGRWESVSELWRDKSHIPAQELTLKYTKTFDLSENERAFDLLVLPPSWVPVSVFLNGLDLTQYNSKILKVSEIFSQSSYKIPPQLLLPYQNKLVLLANGHKLIGGFRNNEIYLGRSEKFLKQVQFRNLLRNDIHIFFALLSLIIGIICLFIGAKYRADAVRYQYFAVSSLGIIPHHLLTSQIYSTWFNAQSWGPFAFQLWCQLIVWPCYLIFFVYSTSSEKILKFLKKRISLRILYAYAAFVLLCPLLLLKSYSAFALAVYPALAVLGCAAVFSWILMRHKGGFYFAFAFGSTLILTSLLSDALGLDVYFLGYGMAVYSLTGLVMLVADFKRAFKNQTSFASIVRSSLPCSVHQKIFEAVEKQTDLERILSVLQGNTTLVTVLVDICDWGKMNHAEDSKIPSGLIREARLMVFSKIEDTLSAHGFELIKTDGDNLKFVGGLFQEGNSKEKLLAAVALRAIDDILGKIDIVNDDLNKKNLPSINIKVSATMGLCDFGMERYATRIQFDTQGHWVNVAYRLESAMDDAFYRKFGKNCALVSSSLIIQCDDLQLRSRFPDAHVIRDKHGLSYECYVGRHHAASLDLGAFAKGVFGFFAGGSPDAPVSASVEQPTLYDPTQQPDHVISENASALVPHSHRQVVPETERNALRKSAADLSQRRVTQRRRMYLGEAPKAGVIVGDHEFTAHVLDMSPFGLGLFFDALDATKNQEILFQPHVSLAVVVRFPQQDVRSVCEIVHVERRTIRGVDGLFMGCCFFNKRHKETENMGSPFNHVTEGLGSESGEQHKSKDHGPMGQAVARKAARYPVSEFYAPSAFCESPLAFKRKIPLRVHDFSPDGMTLLTDVQFAEVIPGLILRLTVLFPMHGERTISVRVSSVSVNQKGTRMRIGVQIQGQAPELQEFSEIVGRYLVHMSEGKWTLKQLRDDGFLISQTHSAFVFDYPTSSEMSDVARLRLKVWQEKGALQEVTNVLDALDSFDAHSRHFVCRFSAAIVAAGRVVFNDGDPQKLELSAYGFEVPQWLKAEKFVEVSRLVVHKEFRGDDVFLGLLHTSGRITLESGNRYILQSCEDSLLAIYLRFGFKKIGAFTCNSEQGKVENWNVCVLDVWAAVRGDSAGLLGWGLVLSDLKDDLVRRGVIELSGMEKAKVTMLDKLRPHIKKAYLSKKKKKPASKAS